MKEIQRLLKKAKQHLSEITKAALGSFSDNVDGFIEALGLNPDKYKIEVPNGEVGYDDVAALKDCTKTVWADYEEEGGND